MNHFRTVLTRDKLLKTKLEELSKRLNVNLWIVESVGDLVDALSRSQHSRVAVDLDSSTFDYHEVQKALTSISHDFDVTLFGEQGQHHIDSDKDFPERSRVVSSHEFEEDLLNWLTQSVSN